MDYNKTLGICIPTYKRPDQLLRCGQSIIAAAKPYNVPLFLADDSTDETNREVVQTLQAEYSHVYYAKNERNLGIDGNIVHSIDMCACDYAWPLGEDDRMPVHGIKVALEVLEKSQTPPAFVFANYASVDENIARILKARSLPLTEDTYMTAETFFAHYSWSVGFIGACIINKSLWEKVSSETCMGTYFAHVGTIFESIRGREVTLIAQPLVMNRCGGAHVFTWSDDSEGVFSGWAEMTRRLRPFYSEADCQSAAAAFDAAHGLHTLKFLCGQRADGLYDTTAYHTRIRPMPRGAGYKLAAWLIAVSDRRLFKILRRALERTRQRHSQPVVGIK